jgi:hypothetical protein
VTARCCLVIGAAVGVAGCHDRDRPAHHEPTPPPVTALAPAAPDPAVAAACDRIWQHRVDWWIATAGGDRPQAERDLAPTAEVFRGECPRWAPATRQCMEAAGSSDAYTQCEQHDRDAVTSECARLWRHRIDVTMTELGKSAADRAQLEANMKPTADVFTAACPGATASARACMAAATSIDAFSHCH